MVYQNDFTDYNQDLSADSPTQSSAKNAVERLRATTSANQCRRHGLVRDQRRDGRIQVQKKAGLDVVFRRDPQGAVPEGR